MKGLQSVHETAFHPSRTLGKVLVSSHSWMGYTRSVPCEYGTKTKITRSASAAIRYLSLVPGDRSDSMTPRTCPLLAGRGRKPYYEKDARSAGLPLARERAYGRGARHQGQATQGREHHPGTDCACTPVGMALTYPLGLSGETTASPNSSQSFSWASVERVFPRRLQVDFPKLCGLQFVQPANHRENT